MGSTENGQALATHEPAAAKAQQPVQTISEDNNSYLTRHLFGNFVFGTGTAAYQVEGGAFSGGRGPSIWDHFTLNSPDKIADKSNGNVACDTYHRYKEDIRMMKEMGFDAYRFSISWSRILPRGRCAGGINQEGIDYYNDVIDTVIANGMKPYVTLFHFDTPLALEEEYGGFLNEKIKDDFREYAEICFWEFGDRVKWWTTINEPWTYVIQGYVSGLFPPGIKSNIDQMMKSQKTSDESQKEDVGTTATIRAQMSHHAKYLHTVALAHQRHFYSRPIQKLMVMRLAHENQKETTKSDDHAKDAYIVARNLLLAHAEAVHTYRTKFKELQGGVIGIVHNPIWYEPLDENSKDDMDAVKTLLDYNLGWFLEPLLNGKYPASMRKIVPDAAGISDEQAERLKDSIDFLGLNYYTTKYATRAKGDDADGKIETLNEDKNKHPIGTPSTGSDWLTVVPWGIYRLLAHMKKTYPNVRPIYITENGYSDADDWKLTVREACRDTVRTKYHQDHLAYILKAINEGVDVRGYFIWSWCDNFEWYAGYKSRFGITYVDYKNNLVRYPKDSARWFTKFLKKLKRPLLQNDDKSDHQDEKRARVTHHCV